MLQHKGTESCFPGERAISGCLLAGLNRLIHLSTYRLPYSSQTGQLTRLIALVEQAGGAEWRRPGCRKRPLPDQ